MGAVEVIEALILADKHDDMLDRAGCRRATRCGNCLYLQIYFNIVAGLLMQSRRDPSPRHDFAAIF